MNIFFLLYRDERSNPDRESSWQKIESALKVTCTYPGTVKNSELNDDDIIITHRQEYADNIKQKLVGINSFVVVFSGGVTGCNRDNERENTVWVEFPTEIEKTVSLVSNLINNQNTVDYQSAIKALIQSFLNKQPHYLIALSILCQGYLAAHGGEGLEDEWKKVWEKLPDDLKDKQNPYQLIEEKRNSTKDKNDFWKNVIDDRKKVEDELSEDDGEKLTPFLNVLYGKGELSMDIVKNAYIALKSILKA